MRQRRCLPLLCGRGEERLDHHHRRNFGPGVLSDGIAGEFTGGVGSGVGRECVCEWEVLFSFFCDIERPFEKLAYSIVGFHGSGGNLTYGDALGAVFLEGCVFFFPLPSVSRVSFSSLTFFLSWLFLVLSLLGIRQWIARIMPQSLVLAVGAGIGLFIA